MSRYKLLFLSLLILVSGVVLFRYYITPEGSNVSLSPSGATRKQVVNVDSIKSVYEIQYREKLQSEINAFKALYTDWQASYHPKAQKAHSRVIQYQKQPTLSNCDTAVKALAVQVAALETGLAIQDSIIKGQDKAIGSFAGTIQRKDSLIGVLNTGWKAANQQLANEQGKVQKRNKLLKVGGGIIAVLVGIVAIK